MTVLITAPEAIKLVGASADRWSVRIEALTLPKDAAPDDAKNALLEQGPCAFLHDGKCGVYDHRPDACRACHVWHDSWYCGRSEWDMCTPAELNQLRIENAYKRMLAELDAGRRPFWGYLLPAVALAAKHRTAYCGGADLVHATPEDWLRTELIEFPSRDRLSSELAEHEATFAEEPSPMGSPRASEAADRTYLAPFPDDD